MSINSNLKFEKTTFLNKANSSFIEEMYLKYLNKDSSLSSDWKKYFEELKEETSIVYKELDGPSWQPHFRDGPRYSYCPCDDHCRRTRCGLEKH